MTINTENINKSKRFTNTEKYLQAQKIDTRLDPVSISSPKIIKVAA